MMKKIGECMKKMVWKKAIVNLMIISLLLIIIGCGCIGEITY